MHNVISKPNVPISLTLSEIKASIPLRTHRCGAATPIRVACRFDLAHPAELGSFAIETEDAFSFLAAVLFDQLLKGLAILVC